MHRYVVAMPEGPAAAANLARLRRRLAGWDSALAADGLHVWVSAAPPSALGWRRLGDHAVEIGRSFPADGAGAASPRWGAWVTVAGDPAARRVVVTRDPTGRIEAWRARLGDLELVFSHHEDVAWLAGRPADLNWDFLAFHLNTISARGRETGLAGVLEIVAGEAITYTPQGLSCSQAWRPHEVAAHPFDSADAAQRAIRAAADAAAVAWAGLYPSLSLDLSGGLDSAIVLGLLRKVARHPRVRAINWVIPHAEGDERAFAHAAAAMHDTPVEEVAVPVAESWTPNFTRQLMRPVVRTMPLGYDQLAEAVTRTHGIAASCSGTGGDHLFHEHLPPDVFADVLAARLGPVGATRAAHELALMTSDTIWHVLSRGLASHRRRAKDLTSLLRQANPFISPAAAATDFARFSHPWLLEAPDDCLPGKLAQIRHLVDLQHHYWRFGRAEAAEELHPLVSQPLIEACLRTRSFWFAADGLRRGLARRVFADLLPEAIRWRRTKGATSSHWVGLLTRHAATAREILLDGELAARGLLDRDAIEAALQPMAIATGKHFVRLANCLTTEMWIQDYRRRTAAPGPRARLAAV